MTTHRLAVAHANALVSHLLETVIDSAGPLKVAKLEGDAAFLYAPLKAERSSWALGKQIAEIRRAFNSKRNELSLNRFCTCNSCVQVATLSLKFVAHVGEIIVHKVKQYTELAGVDVILVHRMLKNEVRRREYVLLTDSALQALEPEMAAGAHELMHDFEGLGTTRTHFVDLSTLPVEDVVEPKGFWGRFWQLMRLNVAALPFALGTKSEICRLHEEREVEPASSEAPAGT